MSKAAGSNKAGRAALTPAERLIEAIHSVLDPSQPHDERQSCFANTMQRIGNPIGCNDDLLDLHMCKFQGTRGIQFDVHILWFEKGFFYRSFDKHRMATMLMNVDNQDPLRHELMLVWLAMDWEGKLCVPGSRIWTMGESFALPVAIIHNAAIPSDSDDAKQFNGARLPIFPPGALIDYEYDPDGYAISVCPADEPSRRAMQHINRLMIDTLKLPMGTPFPLKGKVLDQDVEIYLPFPMAGLGEAPQQKQMTPTINVESVETPTPQVPPKEYNRWDTIAKALHVHKQTARRFMKKGSVKILYREGHPICLQEDIDDYLNRRDPVKKSTRKPLKAARKK